MQSWGLWVHFSSLMEETHDLDFQGNSGLLSSTVNFGVNYPSYCHGSFTLFLCNVCSCISKFIRNCNVLNQVHFLKPWPLTLEAHDLISFPPVRHEQLSKYHFVPDPGLVWRSIPSVGVVGAKERSLTVGRVCLRWCRSLAASLWSSGSCSGRPVVVREHFCVFPLLYFSPAPTPPFSELTFFHNLFFFFLCPFIHITFSHDCPSPRPIKFKAIWWVTHAPPPPKNSVSLPFPISCPPALLLPLPLLPKWQASITVCHLAELQVESVIVLLVNLLIFFLFISRCQILDHKSGLNAMEMQLQLIQEKKCL